ncbi:hypothetical protein DSA33_19065 [Salmonella enterica]|nr:hypothetical protein [Salmonella enterica]
MAPQGYSWRPIRSRNHAKLARHGLALTGRRTRRSNLLPADLSLTPVTSLSMLLGTHSLAAFKQLELFWV